MNGATPRPWLRTVGLNQTGAYDRVSANGGDSRVADCRIPADAALIVLSVNAHDDLVAACKAHVAAADAEDIPGIVKAYDMIRAALKKAGEP